MIITEHAKQRLRERCGFNKKSYERMVRRHMKMGFLQEMNKVNWFLNTKFKKEYLTNEKRDFGLSFYFWFLHTKYIKNHG